MTQSHLNSADRMPRQADVISATVAESAELALENNTAARQQLIELIWESLLCVHEKHTHILMCQGTGKGKVIVRAGMLLNDNSSLFLFA